MDATITTTRGRRVRRLVGLGLVAGLTIALVACGDDDDDDAATSGEGSEETTTTASGGASDPYGEGGSGDESGGEAGAGDVAYPVTELSYADVSAPGGGTIAIENTSGAPHTFTADDGAFDVPFGAEEGATVDVPAEAGEYPFHCEIHSSMAATLTVE
jgi:plastocyanin